MNLFLLRKEWEMLKKVKVFFKGVAEFRSGATTHYGNGLIEVYDLGRELAHRLTFRRFEA